jgi:hypothetical protein
MAFITKTTDCADDVDFFHHEEHPDEIAEASSHRARIADFGLRQFPILDFRFWIDEQTNPLAGKGAK